MLTRMRRTERLFAIIQVLRSRTRPVTARELARELEVSLRTVYRDTAELVAQRVPIRGEAGTGYVLDAGYDLPPLMLTPDELEAAMLGASWVSSHGDVALARAARSLLDKIADVVPSELRPVILDGSLRTSSPRGALADVPDLGPIRRAIRESRKIEIEYVDERERATRRTIWPIVIAYSDRVRVIVAHCELRGGMRHFRTDRIRHAEVLEVRYRESQRALRKRWLAEVASETRDDGRGAPTRAPPAQAE
jgi:predicted DNA-binding transcriptional regulator YafY